MTAIKPIDQSGKTWEERSMNASADYVRGAANPRRPWAASTAAAEGNYKTAVVAAANAGRFAKGVTKAGDAKWAGGISRKGKANYETGVSGAAQNWITGFSPFQAAIASLNLTPRGPKNSAANYERSKAMGQAMAQVKARLGGAA